MFLFLYLYLLIVYSHYCRLYIAQQFQLTDDTLELKFSFSPKSYIETLKAIFSLAKNQRHYLESKPLIDLLGSFPKIITPTSPAVMVMAVYQYRA